MAKTPKHLKSWYAKLDDQSRGGGSFPLKLVKLLKPGHAGVNTGTNFARSQPKEYPVSGWQNRGEDKVTSVRDGVSARSAQGKLGGLSG